MKQEIEQIRKHLEGLKHRVETEDLSSQIEKESEWGGADVIITSAPLKRETSKTIVVPNHAKALSWLFVQLRDSFSSVIDYVNKHQFYGRLADAALRYQSEREVTQQGIMNAVLHEASAILDNIERKGTF